MNKVVLSLAAVSALAIAAPAAAQYASPNAGYGGYGTKSPDERLDRVQARLDAAVRAGTISAQEASRLRAEAWQLRRLYDQYSRNGMSLSERSDLARRYAAFKEELRADGVPGLDRSDDRDYRSGGYDNGPAYDDRYDRGDAYDRGAQGYGSYDQGYGAYDQGSGAYDQGYGAYGQGTVPYDQGNDAYDQGSDAYDRGDSYGSYDNGPDGSGPAYDNGPDRGPSGSYAQGYGQGGPAPADAGRELRVGDRAPAGLGAVPPEFSSRYRDGNGVYYRYDDGRVYQIETATNTIRWIGDLPY